MTQSVDAPFPPPSTHRDAPSGGDSSKDDSTKDVAKDQAKNVGHSAAQAGSAVASTAADQAKSVAQETQHQAQDLFEQGRSQVREQAVSQQQKAAQGLSSLAEQLRGMADGNADGAPGPARDLVHQASSKLEEVGSWLEDREPGDLLDEVRRYARRKPGMFLLGAAVAGVVAGRLTSGVKAAHDGGSGSLVSKGGGSDSGSRNTGSDNYVAPLPSYADRGRAAGPGTAGEPPLPPPPYGTVPPEGSVLPPTAPAGWDDPARPSGGVS